jgi:biopolymer transport protein ExbB
MLCAGPALASAPGAQTIMVTRNDGILEIVGNADPVVKGVMALLIVASIASWALWVLKAGQLRAAKTALRRDIAVLASATSLKGIGDVGDRATVEMLKVAAAELALGGDTPSHRMLEGIEERVAVQLPIVEARAIHHMLAGTNLLGSIGSIAPFVGLAGTVWGIVNSFLSIARSHATSLAVVAPGIAEALIATAMGLAAAIPAVLIYNSLSRSIAGYRRMLSEVSVLVACVLSREAERRDVVEYGGVSSLEARRIGGRSGGVAASSEAGR